jgi:TRAP-type mannitol/chloroaromatic compound transport system permease large subunit
MQAGLNPKDSGFYAPITLVCLILLLVLGMRIGYAALISGVIALVIIYPNFNTVGTLIAGLLYTSNAQYALTVIPLFVLMGYIALEYGIGEDIFYTARCWLGRLPRRFQPWQ